MATIVFDFDSTLVTCESLELILERRVRGQPELMEEICKITEAGIRGKIPFSESLAKRLAIVSPSREDVQSVGEALLDMLTPGMEGLIQGFHQKNIDVWIVSGGVYESLIPVGQRLGIDISKIFGVKLLWNSKGKFRGIDTDDPFSRSKVEGVRGIIDRMGSPKIAVGDAMSDYRLFKEGLVEHFILYTETLACQEIIELGVDQAKQVAELEEMIHAIVE